MKRIIPIALLIFLMNRAFAESPEMALQKLLVATNTYSAHFMQTTKEGGQAVPRVSLGRIYLEKPNRFRWEIKSPNPQTIVSDGHFLWVYDPSLRQVTQQKVTAHTFDPALLLTGNSKKILRQFKITWLAGYGGWYQLQPRHAGSGILVIRLQYRQGQLSKIQVMNNLNQVSVFTFSQITMNSTLPARLFQFSPPKGATVLRSEK